MGSRKLVLDGRSVYLLNMSMFAESSALARSLAGQNAVVTGGSKGIGFAIAQRLADEGANVLIAARDAATVESAPAELPTRADNDQQIAGATGDTSSRAGVEKLFEQIKQKLPGPLDVFVPVSYGTVTVTDFLALQDDEWGPIIDTNLTGTFRCVQRAAQVITAAGASNRSIVVVSSIRATGVRPRMAPYSSAKVALSQLARVAAYELAPSGIQVNAVCQGLIVIPMSVSLNGRKCGPGQPRRPTGRCGRGGAVPLPTRSRFNDRRQCRGRRRRGSVVNRVCSGPLLRPSA